MMNKKYDYSIRKTLIPVLLLLGTCLFGQVGIQTNTPDASSALDIVATNKGLLIPRVTLTAVLTNPSPVTAPATGLMVFNSGANQPVGFYYWDGSTWVAVGSGGSGSGDSWLLEGNAGTSDGTDFIGTTDDEPLNFRINDTESGRLTSNGTTFLGYQAGFNSGSIQNTAIGYQSHFDLSSGKYNTAIGYQSAYTVTSGNYNVAVGYNALITTKSGANNVAIGHDSGPLGDSWANTISIGWGANATGSNEVRLGNDDIEELFCMGAYDATSSNAANMYVDANGQIMRSTAGAGAGFWGLEGNSGTDISNDFIGTTDAEGFAIRTDDDERMRFTEDGQALIGLTTAYAATDFVTIESTSAIDDALRIVAPGNGVRIDADGFGLISFVDNASGFPFYAKNFANSSYGGFAVGSNKTAYVLSDHYSGISSHGEDGALALAQESDGIGVIAGGNNVSTLSSISTGCGGAFTGYHGLYGKAINTTAGVGVIGVGNNGSTYTTTSNGSGGAFTGYHGLISSGTNTTYGTGVIGVGNGGSYYLYNDGLGHQGSGGAFTGGWCGVAGWADNNNNNSVGVYGYYNGTGSTRDGKGVVGIAVANTGRGYGVWGQGNRYGVYANGNMGASGTKSFEIDHPLEPEEKTLKHYSMESPEVLNLYRGSVNLDDNGVAVVELPDYFLAININFTYSLTAIGQQAPNIYISKEIDDSGSFEISGGSPGQKISWVVYAERNDLFVQKYKAEKGNIVEIEKEEDYKGKYLMPELYDQPAEMGMFYTDPKRRQLNSVKQKTVEDKVLKISLEEIEK